MIAQFPMKPEWQKRATNQRLVFTNFCACNSGADFAINDMTTAKTAALIKSMRLCKGGNSTGSPSRSLLIRLRLAKPVVEIFQLNRLWCAIYLKHRWL